jgi:hypothetical protein
MPSEVVIRPKLVKAFASPCKSVTAPGLGIGVALKNPIY